MTAGELKAELDSRGFFLSDAELADDLAGMHDAGLVTAELLAAAGGASAVVADEFDRVEISSAGLRRLASIIRV